METQNSKKLVETLNSNVQKITQNINQIENLSKQIGTNKDSQELRNKINNIQATTKDILGDSQKKLKELHNYSSSNSGELKIVKERLRDEFLKIVQNFQLISRAAIEKEKSHELVEKSFSTAMFTRNEINSIDTSRAYEQQDNFQQKQQMQQNDNLNLVVERQKKFVQLESDIVDLNSMFKDLAVMVHDQGEIIDNIENNIDNVQVTVVEANKEIVTAKNYQSKARKKKICIFLIVFFVLVALVLIVTLSITLNKK